MRYRFTVGGIVTVVACVGVAPACSEDIGVGDPCTPELEYDPSFNGFDKGEVYIESRSFQCKTRVCLVNHFQGRVSCAYGQGAHGEAPSGQGTSPCAIPGTQGTAVVGNRADQRLLSTVRAQCMDRAADKSVYCSCRCANADGRTDDGAIYCGCPDGYSCEQLRGSIGSQFSEGQTGAYCIKNGTKFSAASHCAQTCQKGRRDCD